MGSTTSPQGGDACPNCQQPAQQAWIDDDVRMMDCHNPNCSIDRFWAER